MHIPLTKPETPEEVRAMARKNKVLLAPDADLAIPQQCRLSGAEIEGVITRARRKALLAGTQEVATAHLREAFEQFIPPEANDEIELQTLSAVLECTDGEFLPAEYRQQLSCAQNPRRPDLSVSQPEDVRGIAALGHGSGPGSIGVDLG